MREMVNIEYKVLVPKAKQLFKQFSNSSLNRVSISNRDTQVCAT